MQIFFGFLGLVLALVFLVLVLLVLIGRVSDRSYRSIKNTCDLGKRIEEAALKMIGSHKACLTVAVLQQDKTLIRSFGMLPDKGIPADQLIYEIGSITKVFTATLFAKLVMDGKVRLNDTLGSLLPQISQLSEKIKSITLLQLATHTSGLPRLPPNLDATIKDQNDPYALYTESDLIEGLVQCKLTDQAGATYSCDYSNLGMALLGYVLTQKTGQTFEQLLQTQICQPLGLNDTVLQPTVEQQPRVLPGHDDRGNVVPHWSFQVMSPAGAIYSTAGDLLRFVQAYVTSTPAELSASFQLALKSHYQSFLNDMGLGWHRQYIVKELTAYWHNGGTGGFSTYLAISPRHKTGVVLLYNRSEAMTGKLDDLGLKLFKWCNRISLESCPSVQESI